MQFTTCKVSDLKPSPLNPPQRKRNVAKLAKSIKQVGGLLQPIVVASNKTIIDGHRRLMACKILGLENVPIIIHNSSSSKEYDSLFVQTNEHTQLMNGNQYLWRYMNGADVPNYHLTRIKWLEKALGKTYAKGMFERILQENKSANTYQMAMGIYCKYTNKRQTNKKHMRELAYYLLNIENCYRLKSAIAHFIPIKLLVSSVVGKRKLKAEFTNKD
jgi:hypothetical protein|tara:strand:+ start:3532 stop:4179 length:648 start_codon:yes stop_codon:yes gene_type:complete